jgi:hypothetical protein
VVSLRRPARRASERGVALLLTLFLLLLVEGALLLFAGILVAERRAQLDSARRLRLDVLVDSAADATLARLAQGDDGGLPPIALAGGEISSHVEPIGASRYRIEARSQLGGMGRVVELEAERSPGGAVRVVRWRPLGVGPAEP